MKTITKILFIASLFLPLTLSAQWTDHGTASSTTDNISLGAGNNNTFSLFVRKDKSGWQGRFLNRGGSGSDVYLAHGAGYGMHIRGWTTGGQYTLQLYNKTAETNAFLNNGNVGLGLVGNVGIGTRTPAYKLQVMGNSFVEQGLVLGSGNSNHIRMIQGNYGFIHRNDGTNYWMLTTASGDQNGSWSSKRPFRINIPTGNVYLGDNNLNVVGTNVGVQTANPKGHLQVNDRLVINSPGSGYWGWIGNNVYWDSNASADNNPKRVVSGHAAEYGFTNTGDLLLRTAINGGANTKVNYKLNMIIKNNGGIGINTWNVPVGYELAINGKMIVEECKVKPSNFWDEVFTDDYDLMTMEEKQAFTQREHHLPSFEPEAVIVSEGMNVGESFADVAKELEEAHLYIFQLNDMIKELRKEIDDLKEQVNK